MPSIKKARVEEIKKEAEIASEKQMQDIFAAISGLGSSKSEQTQPAPSENSNTFEIKQTKVNTESSQDFKTVTTSSEQNDAPKNDKPGYVSLVIPNSLKKKWKLYSAAHGMSLTDCLKLGMKLLEEMEQQGKIKIEEGFLTING